MSHFLSPQSLQKKLIFPKAQIFPTKVLLIIIYNMNATLITHDFLYTIFSQYGAVEKILIFEKNRIWKAFVEMSSFEEARRAQTLLNNSFLLNDGSKMTVHFACLNEISLNNKNGNNGGVDYSSMKEKFEKKEEDKGIWKFDDDFENFQSDSIEEINSLSKESNKKRILDKFESELSLQISTTIDKTLSEWEQASNFYFSSKNLSLDPISQNSGMKLGKSLDNISTEDYDSRVYSKPNFFQNEPNSRVLYLRGIYNKEINFQVLYNLFSNYGNICKMLMIPAKNTALIEFQDVHGSKIAKDHLNNIKLLGSQIKIFYSNYNEIVLKSQFEEIYVADPNSFRIGPALNFIIQPPSKTLKISGFNNIINDEYIKNLFSSFGVIEKFRVFFEDYLPKILIRYSALEESVNTLTKLHNIEIFENFLSITFTNMKV